MGISSLPAFQRALLKRQAQSKGAGRAVMQTDDISAAVSRDVFGRQMAFNNIGLAKRGRLERGRQFGENMKFKEGVLEDQERQLPWRIGLGLLGGGMATMMGRERRNTLMKESEKQDATNAMLTDLIRKPEYKKTKERLWKYGMNTL